MKILRFVAPCTAGEPRYGIVEGQEVTLAEGELFGGLQPTGTTCTLEDIERILPPVDPPNVIAIGLNYRKHAEEGGMPIPDHPVVFIKATTSVCGQNDNIVLPKMAPDEVDYEAELAIIIGRQAKNVSEGNARDYILGYACGNDVSARDCQLRLDAQWARGKSFDTFAPIGPWIETDINADDRPIRSRLNGKIMQESNTSDLIFSTTKLVSYLSQAMTLEPGTVIMTGTPSGVGFVRKPPVFLKPGDTIEVEINGIGTLTNKVVAE